ncbi:MAG: membrane protein insertion efficiency factor YidD [Candidatus Berkiellales bacterium]
MVGNRGFATQILLKGIALYRWLLSPMLGRCCRFYPSCSHYAQMAIEKYGALKGIYLTGKRVLKCHPWCDGGIDEVP